MGLKEEKAGCLYKRLRARFHDATH